jgi:D-amino peptidase
MYVLISADMEGISGVVTWDHVDAQHKEYDRFRKLMTDEVNAAIEGALSGGAERIVVNDSHGGMKNILIEELNSAAELISGSPKPFGMMQGIGPDVDAVFLVGYHAAAGTAGAILSHTWSARAVTQVQLNGQVVGETGLNAALAGSFGAPVALVTGDRAVTEEARALLGEIETVPVKEGITRSAAQCLHPEVVRQRIRQAAERALQASSKIAPFVLEPPITVRVTFKHALQADLAAMIPYSRRVDGLVVEWTGDDMPTVYKTFCGMVSLT